MSDVEHEALSRRVLAQFEEIQLLRKERDRYRDALVRIVTAWTHVKHDEPPCGICVAREAVGLNRW